MEAEGSPSPSVTPPEKPGTTPAPEATPAEETTPTPHKKKTPAAMTSQVPFVPAPSAEQEAPVVQTSPLEEEANESKHFQDAKARALADPHIQDLQSAMDGATGDDAKAASRRYYKALYEKMREIDPSVKDRIDRTEAATMRRVEQEQ